ncbi:larval cuticle protein F1-like [Amyelois transitella]|uniref:larval cuticle protein F1-like n=1 Tax=Amyelois transitella TaxID=680683 RepID=UPI00067D72E6|nr:larval cuticle protein F1-like [Amyelois transitella]
MKAALCVLLLATAVFGAEEKKTEKRGVLGLGYGVGAAPLVSHGYYGHGLGLYNHGVGLSGYGLGHGIYGGGLYGGGLYGHGLLGHGLVGHAAPISAPLLSHSYSSPLLGLGHGWH